MPSLLFGASDCQRRATSIFGSLWVLRLVPSADPSFLAFGSRLIVPQDQEESSDRGFRLPFAAPRCSPAVSKRNLEGERIMLAPIYLAIESLLNVDGTLSPSDKSTILMVCQHPDRFLPHAYEPLPQLLTQKEVTAMLKVSRCTIWRMVRGGKLRQVMVGESPRFRLDDVMSALEQVDKGTGETNEQSTGTTP